jgi:3-oxoacyl-[acyl-carrier protein] reductase
LESQSKPLAGRVALVTGVSRRQGIGAGLARRLLADGASVLASGWEPHDAEMRWGADVGGVTALLDPLGGPGARLDYRAADLERPEAAAVVKLVARLVSDEAAWITGQVHDHEGGFRRWARPKGE